MTAKLKQRQLAALRRFYASREHWLLTENHLRALLTDTEPMATAAGTAAFYLDFIYASGRAPESAFRENYASIDWHRP
jgi:hypothetical protein